MDSKPTPSAAASIPNPQKPEACVRVSHANGIEELILKEVSHHAVDAWLKHLSAIMGSPAEGTLTVRVMTDSSVGMMPLQYASRRGREWMQTQARLNPNATAVHSRVVFLYDRGFLISLVGNLIRLLLRGSQAPYELRFFEVARRAEAEAWLLLE